MKKKIVFGFVGLIFALFVGNFIGNDVKEAKAVEWGPWNVTEVITLPKEQAIEFHCKWGGRDVCGW